MKNKFFLLIATLGFLSSKAQDLTAANTTMADGMRSNGKIYVVVAVVTTILVGLIAYMIRVDKKVTKLEKEINQ